MTVEAPAETQEFWNAAAAGRLVVKHCRDCGRAHHYPRSLCPHCLSSATEFRDSEGTGAVYSLTTTRGENGDQILAFVTLSEGVTMLTEVVDCDPKQARIGMAVRVAFADRDGRMVPVFRPIDGDA